MLYPWKWANEYVVKDYRKKTQKVAEYGRISYEIFRIDGLLRDTEEKLINFGSDPYQNPDPG